MDTNETSGNGEATTYVPGLFESNEHFRLRLAQDGLTPAQIDVAVADAVKMAANSGEDVNAIRARLDDDSAAYLQEIGAFDRVGKIVGSN